MDPINSTKSAYLHFSDGHRVKIQHSPLGGYDVYSFPTSMSGVAIKTTFPNWKDVQKRLVYLKATHGNPSATSAVRNNSNNRMLTNAARLQYMHSDNCDMLLQNVTENLCHNYMSQLFCTFLHEKSIDTSVMFFPNILRVEVPLDIVEHYMRRDYVCFYVYFKTGAIGHINVIVGSMATGHFWHFEPHGRVDGYELKDRWKGVQPMVVATLQKAFEKARRSPSVQFKFHPYYGLDHGPQTSQSELYNLLDIANDGMCAAICLMLIWRFVMAPFSSESKWFELLIDLGSGNDDMNDMDFRDAQGRAVRSLCEFCRWAFVFMENMKNLRQDLTKPVTHDGFSRRAFMRSLKSVGGVRKRGSVRRRPSR